MALKFLNNGYFAGKVGIGTESPDALLDVSSGSTSTFRLSNTDTALTEGQITGAIEFQQSDSTSGGTGVSAAIKTRSSARPDSGIYFGQSADLGFFVSGSSNGSVSVALVEAMTVRAPGNVGIGTTSPRYKLDLVTPQSTTQIADIVLPVNNSGDDSVGSSLMWKANYTGYTKRSAGIAHIAEGNFFRSGLAFYTNGSTSSTGDWAERMRIDMEGNVGIGTASPNTKLTISASNSGAANNNTLRFVDTDVTTQANQSFGKIEFETKDTNNPGINAFINAFAEGTGGTGALSFGTGSGGSTERMRITSGGNVGIGDTGPAVKLQVSTNSPTNNVAALIGDGWVGNSSYHKEGGLLLVSGTSQDATQTGAGIAFQTRNTQNTNYWKSSMIMDRDGAIRFTLGGAGTVAGSEDFTILSSGNVGIGVTNPGNKLRVEGSVRVNDSGNGQIFFGTGNLNKIELDGTDMKLSSGGLAPTITMSNQGLIKFGLYGLSGQGTPANLLGVDGSGNVVKTNSFNLILDDTPAASTTSGSGNIVNWSVSETVTAGTLYAVKTNGGWTAADADDEQKINVYVSYSFRIKRHSWYVVARIFL